MATDERLKWLELRINSSLRPRNEYLKNMMAQDDNRLAFHAFLNNEDVKRLYVFMRKGRQIEAALQSPVELNSKCVFFLKSNSGAKLTKENIDSEIIYMDCSNLPLGHLELTIREVFLPLLATNTQTSESDIMDILHRLMATVEVCQGLVEGNIVLSLPSIEVLAEAADSPLRRVSVLHVLETTVIGWIKQIRSVLCHNAQSELQNQFGKEPCPLDEIHIWEKHLAQLQSINDQLDSAVAKDILQNLENANSQYAHSFRRVRKEIAKAQSETGRVLKFLSTLEPWHNKLHTSENPLSTIRLFKPLLHVLQLIWTHSPYYHQIDKFHHLLRLLSNEVVHRAKSMVGDNVLQDPLESHYKLKEALRMCAAFRGAYLDFKEKADDQNAKNIAENAERLAARPQGILFTTKVYGPHAYKPQYGIRREDGQSTNFSGSDDDLWTDSPWPARNAPCFDLLNNFMERCNDVLELIETTRHFRILASVAEGGVGDSCFDAMVNELHTKFKIAMKDFFSQVTNVLSINNTKMFELAFFNLRTTIKSLEKTLSEILRFAFEECPGVHSQLRLLEVFEGISGRDLVQVYLKDVDTALVNNFSAELQQVRDIFQAHHISPPCHYNMPQTVSKLMLVRGLKERIRIPMEKMKKVSPHYLEGDRGWQIRNTYTEIMQDLEKFEVDIISKWKTDIVCELAHKLKQPLLIADEYDEDTDVRPKVVHVNLDPRLILLLKEIHYLGQPPFSINLPESASELMRSTYFQDLTVTATQLETIVSKYNAIMRSVTAFEHPMFERKLEQIDKLLEQGLQNHTWKMKESSDFIESAMSLICLDVYQTLDIVQTNFREIVEMTGSWSQRALDVFSARNKTRSYSMDELVRIHMQLRDELEAIVVPAGNTIHSLVQQSYEVVQISQASPAWKDYVDYIDAIVLDGLKQTTLASLKAMFNSMVKESIKESAESLVVPIVTVRLELVEDNLTFCPPFDQSTSVISLQEIVQTWLQSYVARGKLIKMFGPKGSYEEFISVDEEVKQLVTDIVQVVDDSSQACKQKLLDIFKTCEFLWKQDVNQTFANFLNGVISPKPQGTKRVQRTISDRQNIQPSPVKSEMSSVASRVSSAKSCMSVEVPESSEFSFVSPKTQEGEKSKFFSLDDFDLEIDIYKTARDEVMELEDYYDEGWIRVDLKPIKQVLTTYASKWMWTFTKYLADQVTLMLETLDICLTRIEPEIESITGEERDTASFMKMMRLFNEVSAQQNEMDEKFSTMHRTVFLLRKYGQILSEKSQFLFSAAPGRWNNLKTKVSLAKQRLGPRIQEESARITKDLETFAARLTFWYDDLKDSKVYQRDCSISDAKRIVESFSDRFLSLENEAQDLVELQELLESSVVNFSLLPIYQQELLNLKNLWQTTRVIQEQHEDWKGHRWQKINTRFLREETDKQMDSLEALPEAVFSWDVYIGLHESVTSIQTCLPLIDNLSNPAMRTRHWKQLVRVTGGVVIIDSDTLKKMTLRELLNLGLQHHVDDVRAIVQRAVKDLDIESALKTSEEVWLSKVFDFRLHVRNKPVTSSGGKQDKQNERSQNEATRPLSSSLTRNARTTSRISNNSFNSKNQRNSISSLPASLLNFEDEPTTVMLLTNTDHVFEELENHQVKLQAMQSNTAAGSFLDEVLKWQKRLQIIETVLQMWLEVQDKWMQMEEVYTSTDVCQSLSHDGKRFEMVNKDFKHLMGATEKNPNVLQCCNRKNILKILENMSRNLEICHKSLLHYLERRRENFPRFFFLSMEDVLHIMCSGHDLNVLNLYINKLLENVGSLLYEKVGNNENYSFVITGILDVLGERLLFDEAVCCEGQIEAWLSGLLRQIKVTLKSQLAHALKTHQPVKLKSRVIQSAGARKVSIPLEDKNEADDNITSEWAESTANPAVAIIETESTTNPSVPIIETEATTNPAVPIIERSNYESGKILEEGAESVSGTKKESSWILDHATEIIHLATHIQMTSQISKALEEFNNGNKNALKESLKMIGVMIDNTITLMKDLKREEKEITNQEKEKQEFIALGCQREQEYGGELDIPVMKSPFDKGHLNVVRESSHLSSNVDFEMKSRTSDDERTSTTAPLDALSMILPTPGGGRASSIGNDQAGGQDEFDKIPEKKLKTMKLILFPSQIHKLRSLLLLLAQIRDLMKGQISALHLLCATGADTSYFRQRLITISKHSSPTESFDWKCQLNYKYDEETKTTSVVCMKAHFDYGFEYLGSADREVTSPLTDKIFVMIAHAIQAHVGVLCLGPNEDSKSEITHEISKCLGQPRYMFNCTRAADHIQIQNIFRGMASTGCWVCFNNISLLSLSGLSLISQLMSVIMGALRARKSTVHLQSEEIQLSQDGACFGLMNSHVPVIPQDTDKLLIYPSAASQLPDTILNQFRIVSLTKPDFVMCVEVFLFSQGFTNGHELARKMNQLYEICVNMFGTNTLVSKKITLGSAQSACFFGWSMHSMKRIIRLAGVLLENIQVEHAEEEQSGSEDVSSVRCWQEDKALVTAFQNTSIPRMTSRDANLFSTIVGSLWPNTEIPFLFSGDDAGQNEFKQHDTLQVTESELRINSSRSRNSQRSIKDPLNLNTSLVPLAQSMTEQSLALSEMSAKQVLEDLGDAIAAATADLGLLLSATFQARVMQLSQLSTAHQSIFVIGVPGCGKSECIKTFAVAEKKRGKQISVQSIFIKAVEDRELFGHYDENTREWKDGLFTVLLRKFCLTAQSISASKRDTMKILQLDGECDGFQMELLHSILNHNGSVVLANNERMRIPDTLRFIWELDKLENISPSLLATTGVIVMNSSDVGWKMMLNQWLKHRHEPDKELLTELFHIYLEKVVDKIINCTHLNVSESKKKPQEETSQFKRVISHSIFNMMFTFTKILEVLVNSFTDLNTVEYERYINYSAVWAFGGTLAEEHRQEFSDWWKEQFGKRVDFPNDGTVFDYVVNNETRGFCKWSDLVPSYVGTPRTGIPQDAFVHTTQTEQLLHLLGLLTDAGKSVMLVGENGCGKTAIINERIHTVCSGEVADVISLTVNANRFTNSRVLFERLDKRLEWKHGQTFVPRGNKRLLCMVDDINLSQTDKYGYQTACELIREHLDDGGFYSSVDHLWRYVTGVTYVTSVNLQTTANVPALSPRLLRHFAIFGCPYPRATELQTIFSTLLSSHFFTPESSGSSLPAAHHQSVSIDKGHNSVCFIEQSLQAAMVSIVKVTVELFERMRSMFLPTSHRCHYLFTTRDLGNIFRNICLSLRPGCNKRNLFLLWQHECFWICGKRMVSEVDFRRFRQAYVTAVKKQFIDDAQITTIIKRCPPLFSNLIEQDGGVVTAGINEACNNINISEEDAKTDLYRPAKLYFAVKDLLQRGLDEYNKVHPHIRLVLYKSVIEQVCRLSRVIASPHEVANTVLVAEGCPERCSTIVRFSAFLCGFSVLRITPTTPKMSTASKIECFKTDIFLGYTRAGTKKEKVLLLLHEEELADKDCLVFLTEFIIPGVITHLFSQEEQTTIINSVRTDVTQAGLTYSRDVAWNYFLRTAHKNFRIAFITCGGSEDFQLMCREYPAFTKNVNFIWFPHWSKTQLIEHAMFHLKDVKWMSDVQKENVAHMLASMHLVLRQQDGGERTNGEYAHLNNTSYEKFVERFISLANTKNTEVNKTHDAVTKTLTKIREENKAAIKLKKQLEHEIIVLEERKAGTIKILSQIGQDTAISEQQMRIVRKQMEKITNLKKRLPEYQVAHERAVYKVIAIVADTKKAVKLMSIADLAELRAMQKPALEIEDLMAAIIMLLKSPTADLTWQKGAKRQMANLERFVEELSTFDDFQLPESTLVLVEPYLKNPNFDPETMQKNTNNSACGALCKWVIGVVRYHRMMISKVKPLHSKGEETAHAMDNAQHKMNTLENKRKALEIRLKDLAKSFEEATIDKNEQEKKTVHMRKSLETAAQLRRILNGERQRCQQIFDSFTHRQSAISGGCAMAVAFATYLGPYHHNFRRAMLTVHWPECLRERGIPLVIDSVDSLKGRVVDWSFAFLTTASGASSVYEVDYVNLMKNKGQDSNQVHSELEGKENDINDASDGEEKEDDQVVEQKEETEEGKGEKSHGITEFDELGAGITKVDTSSGNSNSEEDDHTEITKEKIESIKTSSLSEKTIDNVENAYPDDKITESTYDDVPGLPNIQEENSNLDEDIRSEATANSAPNFTSAEYNKYMKSLIKILVGDIILNQWLMKDFGPRQIENAAILCTSWQRPPLMVDPNNEGVLLLTNQNICIYRSKLISLDMESRSDPHFIASLEKAITKGKPVLLINCGDSIDSTITSLFNHCTTVHRNDEDEVSQMINFYGRHILCHNDFKLYLATSLPKPQFNPATASSVTLINFGTSHEMLTEDLLTRAFALIRPELYQERKRALKNLQLQKDTLYKFSEKIKDQVLSSGQEIMLSSPKTLQAITNITEAKVLLATQLTNTQTILDDLDLLKDELYPLARRGALMYSLMRSLASLNPAYQFTMKHFLELFDEAIGMEFPAEFFKNSEQEGSQDSESAHGDNEMRQRANSFISQTTDSKKQEDVRQDDKTDEEDVHDEERPKLVRAETEESASTTAVQRFIHGSESEELPTIELPNIASLPTEEVEYTSYPRGKVKELIDSVTSLVYHKVKMSLFEEDRLLFYMLMLLSMKVEAGEDITNEELSFFLQGNPGLGLQLTLADFDTKVSAPQWLSKEKWEDILALSVLPGPMDSLCVDFAVYSHQWKEWYESPYPEMLQMPVEQRQTQDNIVNKEKTDGTETYERQDHPDTDLKMQNIGQVNDFHKLLILRMLRPDRLQSALLNYSQCHLNVVQDHDEEIFNANEVLLDSRKYWGVLVLLPQSLKDSTDPPASRIKLIKSPVEELADLAKAVKIPVERAVVGEGTDTSIEEVIDAAEKNNGWAVVESIHLATPVIMDKLIQQLQRIHKRKVHLKAEKGEETDRFCIWLTSEKFDSLPSLLVQNLLKIAWNSILSYTDITAEEVYDKKSKDIVDTFNIQSPDSYLKAAIVSSLRLIPKSMLEILTEESAQTKRLVFAVAVIHAILVSHQLFGCVGLVRWYPFGTTQLLNAVEVVSSQMSSRDKMVPSFQDLCNYIPNMIYCPVVSEDADQVYIKTLCANIFKSISKEQSHISLGGILIPVPTNSVVPTEYADWFEKTADGKIALQALHLNTAVERYTNSCRATSIFARLNCMFKTLSMELGEVSTITNHVQINIAKLRSALDICLEQLPQLLDLGDVAHILKMEYDFPYNCPSFSSSESCHVSESIGYVLFQECNWMNTVICRIKQDINDLQIKLIGGSVALPHRLLPQVYCLQEEQVPVSWVHPNCLPCIHSLIPWLEDLNKRHQQLDQFMCIGMVPKIVGQPPKSQETTKGQLKSVWLGGLVNPQALLTALRQEKAIQTGVPLSDVNFECMVLKNVDEAVFEEDALLATDIIMENASWDYETNSLQESGDAGFTSLKALYLKRVVKAASQKEASSNQGSCKEEDNIFAGTDVTMSPGVCMLPVFMNKSRQVQVYSLPVKCPQPEEKWTFVHAAIILNPGLPDEGGKKSRAYLMMQRLPLSTHSSQEKEEAEDEEENKEDDNDNDMYVEDSGEESNKSQVSYKPMSPQGSPLPEELRLHREIPMYEHAKQQKEEEHNLNPQPITTSESNSRENVSKEESSLDFGEIKDGEKIEES